LLILWISKYSKKPIVRASIIDVIAIAVAMLLLC